ncbi:hypothetical protein KY46_14295 [Photobacterium halotolerans]|uniref:Uncharacterized protein n=1 Tax=Photobacterium halotolerans TaxID=265726 RepID=A0A0F5VBT3_9GAMM|nr:hypothetical protein KY46_14295 [Photobacterium halotolerans]
MDPMSVFLVLLVCVSGLSWKVFFQAQCDCCVFKAVESWRVKGDGTGATGTGQAVTLLCHIHFSSGENET